MQCLGRLEDQMGDSAKARRLFKRATKVDPRHVWSYQVRCRPNFSAHVAFTDLYDTFSCFEFSEIA